MPHAGPMRPASPPGRAAVDPGAAGSPPRPGSRWLQRVLAVPDLVTAAAAGFGVGPMLLVLLGRFSAPAGLALGVAGALLGCLLCGAPRVTVGASEVAATGAAVALAVAWFALNLRYSGQDVYATRDPSTYTLAARWLMSHHSLVIDTQPRVFGEPPGANIMSGGFKHLTGPAVYAQANHLLPVVLALGGAVFGVQALFTVNIALGALALLAVFAVARRVAGPVPALLALLALAVSIPMIYVARDPFSEPLTLLYLAGGLALLHRAMTGQRVADYALAGLATGSAAMVRIDSDAALLAVAATGCVVLALARPTRARAARCAAALVLAGAGPAVLGWLDVARLSPEYYRSQHAHIVLLLAALAGVVAVGLPLAWWLPRSRRVRGRRPGEVARARAAHAATGLLVVGFAVLASRPWWMRPRQASRNINLENMQRYTGVTVDGTRLYTEQSVRWLVIYYGVPAVLLGVAGYALLLHALIRRRDNRLLPVLSTGLGLSALYLWNCEITPDQPWAMRRYVPVVLPLLLTAAAGALAAMWRWAGRRWGAGRARWAARAAVSALAASVVAVPVSGTAPVWQLREDYPQYPQLEALCDAIGPAGAVVEVDASAGDGYGQTLRSFCGVPTTMLVRATPAQLAKIRTAVAAHGRTLFVLSENPVETRYASGQRPAAFSAVTTQQWPSLVNRVPSAPLVLTTTVFLSTVDAAGLVQAVPPR